jgi:hypothetical protein
MKLRMDRHSLRIGVSRIEFERLLLGGRIEDIASLADFSEEVAPYNAMTYVLRCAGQFPPVKVQYGMRGITIVLSQEQAKLWSRDGVMGIYSTITMGVAEPFEIIVEKDFGCIDQPLQMVPDPIGPAPMAA